VLLCLLATGVAVLSSICDAINWFYDLIAARLVRRRDGGGI
jgi:hypothetical protein